MSGRTQRAVKALLQAAANGNRKAWEELIDLYAPTVFGVISKYPLAETDAEDVVTTTWLRFLENIDHLKHMDGVGPWLTLVAREECLRCQLGRRRHELAKLEQEHREGIHHHKAHRHVVAPQRLANLAAFLAGPKRSSLLDEWRSHLSGETGCGLARKDQIRAARGFLVAAVRYRLRDAASLAWRPADAVLCSRTLSNLFVWGPVALVLVAIVRHDGRFGLVTDIQDAGELGAFLYGVIRTGRWWRGVKLPEPKARRARSDGGNG